MAKKPVSFVSKPDSFKETRISENETTIQTPVYEEVQKEEINKNVYTHNYTHTHKETYKHELVERERKNRRVQLLTFDSLVDRMDRFAQKRGVSRAEVFEAAVDKYLSELGE